jgi:hypothetical protein
LHIPEVAKVIERAANDQHFKDQLISSPAEAIFEELGFAVPSSVELVVLENSPTIINIVLESVELDDLTLAHVAGGKGTIGSSGGKGAPAPKPAPKPLILPPGALHFPINPIGPISNTGNIKAPTNSNSNSSASTINIPGQLHIPSL